MRKILQCQSCKNEEASGPTLVHSYDSQKPPKSETCQCDQRLWLAAGHFHSVASICRDASRSYRDPTAQDDTSNIAFRKFESDMTRFSLRRAMVQHPERFMGAVARVRPHNPNATPDEALPDIVDQLSALIAADDFDDPARPWIPPSEAELLSVSGYVSTLKDTSTYDDLHLTLAAETRERGLHPWVLQNALFLARLGPCHFLPQQSAILGSDEQARKDMYDLLSRGTGTIREED